MKHRRPAAPPSIRFFLTVVGIAIFSFPTFADPLPIVQGIEFQPFASATLRLLEAMEYTGMPLSEEDREEVGLALVSSDHVEALERIQKVLDPHCLALVSISPESRVKVVEGPVEKVLMQHGWRGFLVKVHNQAHVTAPLEIESPNAAPVYIRSTGKPDPEVEVAPNEVLNRFLEVDVFRERPLKKDLSGLDLEYRIIKLYSRDSGQREASIGFNVGQGSQDIGFRNEVPILFDCVPSTKVRLRVRDVDGSPAMAQFVIRDSEGRIYPAPAKRLAPDFFFHHQVYRSDGETILLPPGEYQIEYSRGPEYLIQHRTLTVPESPEHEEAFDLERWIHVAKEGWISGDHHVHAAGCAHYDAPTKGVEPEDMWRHILGEDLNVGCVLTWGPCWYYQKQFFQGKVHKLSQDNYVMRYDIEVSGFPSSHAGHLSLLRLSEDDYNGVERIEEWPSWDLPVLQWAKAQGGVAGFSHSGWGLPVEDQELPSYQMPPFDGIGANEYIVDVAHDAVDFISAVDTPLNWELSIWYHTLNCGFRTRISGETDFPCIYGERIGLGRSYVKMPEGPIDFDEWAEGIKNGRSYVSTGTGHLLDFRIGEVAVGEVGNTGATSELKLPEAATVTVQARVACFLEEEAEESIKSRPLSQKPYWHAERARIEGTRKVPVELIVNSEVVATKEIEADGHIEEVSFELPLDRSAWVALRIWATAHTNPIFVMVGEEPVRGSVESAQWCLEAVDVCWEEKSPKIREEEIEEAKAAYDFARDAYRKILAEAKERLGGSSSSKE
jgi:hypothetical protein